MTQISQKTLLITNILMNGIKLIGFGGAKTIAEPLFIEFLSFINKRASLCCRNDLHMRMKINLHAR